MRLKVRKSPKKLPRFLTVSEPYIFLMMMDNKRKAAVITICYTSRLLCILARNIFPNYYQLL